MAGSDQKQVRHHRNAEGVLNSILLATDLVLTHSQVIFELPIDLLNRPPSLIRKHHVAGHQLGQIGHQDFCRFRAHVTPFFTQDHGDFANVSQTQAFAVNKVLRPGEPGRRGTHVLL